MENNEIIIHIKYIISNCHIEMIIINIKYISNCHNEFPLNKCLTDSFLHIKSKFEKSFKNEKQIWEDYKYIHNKDIKLKNYAEKSEEILKQFEAHFNLIYEDAKKVYERRNE